MTPMSHIALLSGGHSSALTSIEAARRFGTEHLTLLNHDIIERSEGADIKRFKREIADYIGLPITYCNMLGWDKKDQFDVVIEAKAFKVGNGTALCTNRMKTRPFERWLIENHPDRYATIYYGFDDTKHERGRMQRRSSHLATLGFLTDYPLALWKERTIWNTEEIGIARPNVYERFKHGNCVGCLKAGRQHWYVVYCTRPDVWARAKHAEDEIDYTIIKGTSLEELEPLFCYMQLMGIEPTEHIPAARFWANVRKLIAGRDVPKDDGEAIPCECAI